MAENGPAYCGVAETFEEHLWSISSHLISNIRDHMKRVVNLIFHILPITTVIPTKCVCFRIKSKQSRPKVHSKTSPEYPSMSTHAPSQAQPTFS